MFIQLYLGKKDNKGKEVELSEVLKMIVESAALKSRTKQLRDLLETNKANKEALETREKGNEGFAAYVAEFEKQYAELKGKLPAVTWSGTFTKRSIKGIKDYSQLICLDIDKVENVKELKYKITGWANTYACFISPSGNGLKVIVKVAGNPEKHKDYFESLEGLFYSFFNVNIDKSGKDVSRLCFLCHDPELYINEEALIYTLPSIAKASTYSAPLAPLTDNEAKEFETTITCDDVFKFTEKRIAYTEGNRNKFLWLFTNNCNRKGISMGECFDYCKANMTDRETSEIQQSVENAYNNNAHEHAKYAKKIKTQDSNPGTKTRSVGHANSTNTHKETHVPNVLSMGKSGGTGVQDRNHEGTNGTAKNGIKFWKEVTRTKGRGEDKYEVTTFEISRVKFIDFLFHQGYHILKTGVKGAYQLCMSNDGIIDSVEPWEIKETVFDWCKQNVIEDIEEMMRSKQRTLFSMDELSSMHAKAIDFKKDTEKESYFYFKNAWISVSADGINTHEYRELNQYIWAGNKKDHEFTYQEPKLFDQEGRLNKDTIECEFAKFVFLASYNPNNPDEKDFSEDIIFQRFESFCSAIGFILDGYKHPSDRKGVFALDHKVSERGEKHGRTGKSIIPKACSFLKVVSDINGKTFDPRYAFRYEVITADAQIINFNDMRSNFDPEEIFEIIADDYSILRRNNGYLHFKYENSPKVWYSTNATPKGDGTSYAGRMFTLEFSDYFSPEHTPFVEFGHGLLGSAWDKEEWNRFYNFMLWCVQLYKHSGFVQYPKSNLNERKLKNEVDIEFIDFMDNEVQRDQRLEKMSLLDSARKVISAAHGGGKPLSSHQFYKWIKRYCVGNGLYFNPHIPPGKYDKIGGKEYYTIATTPDFKPNDNEPKLF